MSGWQETAEGSRVRENKSAELARLGLIITSFQGTGSMRGCDRGESWKLSTPAGLAWLQQKSDIKDFSHVPGQGYVSLDTAAALERQGRQKRGAEPRPLAARAYRRNQLLNSTLLKVLYCPIKIDWAMGISLKSEHNVTSLQTWKREW